MSSHDSSEQTPLLEDNSSNNNTAGQQVHRSFLPSIALPWRGGHCRPPKPPGTPPKIDSDSEETASGNGNGNSPHGSSKSNGSRGVNGNGETGPSDGPSDAANGNANKDGNNDGNVNGNGQPSNLVEAPPTGVWGDPAGLNMRRASDESVLLFREAVGIPTSSTRPTTPASELGSPSHCHHHHGGDHDQDPESGGPSDLDRSRKQATGIYARILQEKKSKMRQASVLNGLLNACHVAQILVGAILTTLGPSAQDHSVAITVLGATNTVLAGVFVLMKGQGLPDRFRKEALAFRRVQDWVEETDALIVAGVVGRDRREVGLLVEMAFQKYNAVVANEQTTTTWPEASRDVASGGGGAEAAGSRGMPATPVPVLPTPVATPNAELLVDVSTPGGDSGPGKNSSSVRAVSVGSTRSHRSDNNLNQDGNGSGNANGSSMPGGHATQ